MSENVVNRTYKDTIFRMLFRDRENLLSLYNAISGRHYGNPDVLEIVTLENAIYMGVKNDLAFLVQFELYLFEHQSTVNPNMPYRCLQYVADEYSRLTAQKDVYGARKILLPTPHFVVFYNGTAKQPEQMIQKLSDLYEVPGAEPELELQVRVLNINQGFNEALKEQCKILKEYMQFVERIRRYGDAMEVEEAVECAVEECIREGILREFLLQNRAEVKSMSIYEYDEEAHYKGLQEYFYETGLADGEVKGKLEGKLQSILELLEEQGEIPDKLLEQLWAERDEQRLSRLHKLAAKTASIQDFMNQMDIG